MSAGDMYIDLLPQRRFLEYSKSPGRIREEIRAHQKKVKRFSCVIDEIQKIPALLDEVHSLIESDGIRFMLTGSSARKIRRGGANLLAGRAYTYHLYPLTFEELGDQFDLERVLRVGCLPVLWGGSREDSREFLRSYTDTYLREEVAAEGLVRSIGPFALFLDIMAANGGETVNYSNIARECSVSVKTVQQYYQILEDTFLAFKIPAWTKSVRTRLVAHPRYYLFDTGITNALCHTLGGRLNAKVRGRRFEQFLITQILAWIDYHRRDFQLSYWRTNHGAEVDLLICQGQQILAAIEIKSSTTIAGDKLEGLRSFQKHYPDLPAYVLGIDQTNRVLDDGIQVLSWDEFLLTRLGKL